MPALKQEPAKKLTARDEGKKVLKAKPRQVDVEAGCAEVMAKFPKVLSRLAE